MLQGVDLSMNDSCYPFWENTVEIICQDTCKMYQESSRIYGPQTMEYRAYGPESMDHRIWLVNQIYQISEIEIGK